MGLLAGKVGLVTGGASGLGRATSHSAAREGSRVVVADIDEAGGFAALHEMDDRSWSRTLEVCLNGVFYCMKYEAPAMLERGGGSIVNSHLL